LQRRLASWHWLQHTPVDNRVGASSMQTGQLWFSLESF
jgi:hypothetical protein